MNSTSNIRTYIMRATGLPPLRHRAKVLLKGSQQVVEGTIIYNAACITDSPSPGLSSPFRFIPDEGPPVPALLPFWETSLVIYTL